MGPARPAIFARFGDTFIVRTGTFSASSQTSVAKKGFPAGGDVKDRKILARHRLSRDEKTRWRLQRLVDGIVSNSHKKQMRLQVRLLDDPTPNAFVTGAGYVYVFQGLLDQVKSEDEIATILGHEIAHIDAGHIARRMRTQFWTSLALVTADALTKGETADPRRARR